MTLSLSEILDRCSKLSSTKEKVAFLQNNRSGPLYTVLKFAFDPRIVWALPEGAPPYTPCDLPDQENRLLQEARRLYLFTSSGNPDMHPLRRETLFVQLLESIDPADAKLVLSIKDKKIPYKGITAKLVEEAFPGLIDS